MDDGPGIGVIEPEVVWEVSSFNGLAGIFLGAGVTQLFWAPNWHHYTIAAGLLAIAGMFGWVGSRKEDALYTYMGGHD